MSSNAESETPAPPAESAEAPSPSTARRVTVIVLRLLVSGAIVVGGVAVAMHLMATGPTAKQRPLRRLARVVDVAVMHPRAEPAVVHAMGTVRPAREVEIQPRVSGEVVFLSEGLEPGGSFRAGQTMLQIDPRDFELTILRRGNDVVQAQSNLELELGQQAVAKREYEMLGQAIREQDRALVLRQPQLRTVRALLEAAQTSLEQAWLDLARTTVVAPFNAVVRTRYVDVGAQVAPNTKLAALVGTDAYWVEATVPVDQLRWVDVPGPGQAAGSAARVYYESAWGAAPFRRGRVIRLASDLEQEGRMARLLIEVDDPMSLQPANRDQPRLLIVSYVGVEIVGKPMASVFRVDRRVLHDGETVWVMDGQDKLEIRPVTIAFRAAEYVLVSSGLRDGDRLVLTNLAAPKAGMPLSLPKPPGATRPAPASRPTAAPGAEARP